MLKNSKLNVFGSSASTPDVYVKPKESFWGLAAQALGVEQIDNYSSGGFGIDHVIHMILSEDLDFEQDYFVIGIPPSIRYFGYSDKEPTTWYKTSFSQSFDSHKSEIDSLCNTQIFSFSKLLAQDKEQLDRFNFEWHNVQYLAKIYLLHQFLSLRNANFIMVSLTAPVDYNDQWPAAKNIMTQVKQLPECIIFDNTYQSTNYQDKIKPIDFDLSGWYGHHGAEGNANWFNKIIKPKMIELNWVSNTV